MAKYEIPVWRMCKKVAKELPETFALIDVVRKVKKRYPEVKENTIRCQVIGCSPNHPSSEHYSTPQSLFYYLGDRQYRLLESDDDLRKVASTRGTQITEIEPVEYGDFLARCKKYHTVESRNITFVVAEKMVSNETQHKSEAVRLLLADWNRRHTQKFKTSRLIEEVDRAIKSSEKYLRVLEGERFEDLDLDSDPVREAMRQAFKAFQLEDSIRGVGAAKSLCLLNPTVFLMWDSKIAPKYGCYDRQNPDCYLEFIERTKEKFAPLLNEEPLEKIWGDHLSDLHPQVRKFYSKIGFRESFPKMIDEYNYAKYQKS